MLRNRSRRTNRVTNNSCRIDLQQQRQFHAIFHIKAYICGRVSTSNYYAFEDWNTVSSEFISMLKTDKFNTFIE